MESSFRDIWKYLDKAKKVFISAHVNADGDAVGSALALSMYLRQKGKECVVALPNRPPAFLSFLPGFDEILFYDSQQQRVENELSSSDLVFCVDMSRLKRLQDTYPLVCNFSRPKLLIDHHLEPSDEFSALYSDASASSTAELIYKFIDYSNDSHLINKEMAESLFVGIMTDTGSFSYSCNDAQTFEIAANLIRKGVDVKELHNQVYNTFSEERLRLLGFSISERMLVHEDIRSVFIWLNQEDLEKYKYRPGDTEGIVNYGLAMEKALISILLVQRENHIKLSFRSKKDIPVNQIAKEFNGGGHLNAAGGKSYVSLEKTLENLYEATKEFYHRLEISKS